MLFRSTAEACQPRNNAIDPYEAVTVNLGLVNKGNVDSPSVTATLLGVGGVLPAGTTNRLYGVLGANGAPVTRAFTFSAAGSCGESVPVVLRLDGGGKDLGTVVFDVKLGVDAGGRSVCCTQADLGIAAAGSAAVVNIGDPITYTVWVTNRGPAVAGQVSLASRLGSGLSYVSASSTQGGCGVQGDLVGCSLGDVAPGAVVQATVVVVPRVGGILSSTFKATGANDPKIGRAHV